MSKGYRKRFRKSHRPHEFNLPEPIIQVVQSFLTSKEAARTTLLSKSWHSAWLTRPNLDFDQADFCGPKIDYIDFRDKTVQLKFLDFADKALGRYEDSKLKIHSFRLNLESKIAMDCGYGTPKLIRRALKLGPTRLTFEAQNLGPLIIPDEVLRYENLLSLNVTLCYINLDQELRCSRLRFLSLEFVEIKRRDTILHVLKSCPLIEKLSLCEIYAHVDVDIRLPTIIRHRLKSLVLKHGNIETMFLDHDLSSKFPFLKDLTLHIGNGRKEILISSPTLEHLDFSMADSTVPMVKLDVPSIRKLTFECTLSFPDELHVRANSRGWESCVYVTCDCLTASWFDRLSRFLRKFRFSRISLSLNVHSEKTFDYEAGEIRGLPKLEIENLKIYHVHLPTFSCYALFDGLFRMCRPKRITQYMPNNACPEANNIRFLEKIISDALDANVWIEANQFMYGLNDLKEAGIEVLDDVDFSEDFGDELQSEERITSSLHYRYHSPTPRGFRHQKVRFRLYWKM